MNGFPSRLPAVALIAMLSFGAALTATPVSMARAEGAGAAQWQAGGAPLIDRRGRVIAPTGGEIRGPRFDSAPSHAYRRGGHAYDRGHRRHRHGNRDDDWIFPFAAFAIGALIAGAAAAPPAVAVPVNPHVEWCARTYRGYNPYDNTFQPLYGPRQYCISPYN